MPSPAANAFTTTSCGSLRDIRKTPDTFGLDTLPWTPKSPCSSIVLQNKNFCFRKGPDTSVIYQPEGHPRQSTIDGEIWPPIFQPEHVRSAKTMKVEDDDVFVVTYPKCGTTWIQHICHQLIRGENYQASEGNEMCVQSPMIERMGAKFLYTVPYPRILKTHFSILNVPKSTTAKYIYCVRNPKDCCTSYFHHNRNFKIYNFAEGEWDTFVDLFLSGQLAFGGYFDHLLGWLPLINEPNVLFLMYEDMVNDLEGSIYKIGMFLGGEAMNMVKDSARLEMVVKNSSIQAMKKDQKRWFPESQLNKNEFIRKGGIRDWKNHFTREQSDRMDAIFRTRLSGTIAEKWWQEEMDWDNLPISSNGRLDIEDDIESQVSYFPPHLIDRRYSLVSLLSTGYGSTWSLSSSRILLVTRDLSKNSVAL
ncbi:unnamed protein product [Angiostrongylus costaricensis]|uniref:Sulfotransferase domain-containing protein n=1 Tax=Angiostrongylus costaricensis TaxID=334426 RepID=A0A3P7HM79_ANGCS|nr:unnamed protein product [Angiostrongylus costaricensis]